MEGKSGFTKRPRRQEVLNKKKSREGLIKAASSLKDPLAPFPAFLHYNAKGISAYFQPGCGDRLSTPIKQYIQNLLKLNMEEHYGREWPTEEKLKRREMVAPEARYIFVYELPDDRTDYANTSPVPAERKGAFAGFVHYRFTLEEDLPVLYVYELQLVSRAQGKGLGQFLMQLLEMIALKVESQKVGISQGLSSASLELGVSSAATSLSFGTGNSMAAIMLTVQKTNLSALSLYTKLRYAISSTSPSRVDSLGGTEMNYEILFKALNDEAKTKLQ